MAKNARAAKIGAPQQTILKGAEIQPGRRAWTLNNTPKTTTVGTTPLKTTPIEIGDIGYSVDEPSIQFVNEQSVTVYKEGPQKIFEGNYASNKGRLGNTATRNQIDEISSTLKSRGYRIIGGGKLKEEYLKPLTGGRKGGSYIITAKHPKYPTLRINTVDVLKDGVTPTARELRNAIRIRTQIQPGEHLLLIPKKTN